ncbi:hypothetical protein Vadar_009914 [Vaccinium darrowii]|uniref:Uncharacterized protein n=1 Tax=Vaccinium darrowii TaxID=229202 RepID=A0ACB7XGI2_9ERIC|nr:hypothetical protein Vadar_009914 [Vaccinium darrowii]
MEVVKHALGMDGSLWVDPTGLAGGLAVFWKSTSNVEVKRACSWFIDVQITDVRDNESWRLVNVYFSSKPEIRKAQWEVFLEYKRCLGDSWCLWGDMNCVLNSEEKKGGLDPAYWTTSKFQDFIDQCNLIDLGFTGYPFTWRNNREGEGYIQERLDRALATQSWRTKFAQATVEHIDAVGSDHNALLLCLDPGQTHRHSLFRFDARWVQDDEMATVVENAWKTPISGSRFFSVYKRIKECRCSIINWKKRKRLNAERNITELKEYIKNAQDSPFPD